MVTHPTAEQLLYACRNFIVIVRAIMLGLWGVNAEITQSKSRLNDPSLRQYRSTRQTTMTGECPMVTHPAPEQYYMHVGLSL
jgi:hypothetical protein